MARTAVPVQKIGYNAAVVPGAGTALDPTNGHVVSLVGIKTRKFFLRINSTFAGAKTFTIKAGSTKFPSWKAGAGDLVLSLNAQDAMFTIDPARFMQNGAFINIDVAAGATGAIWALALPDAA